MSILDQNNILLCKLIYLEKEFTSNGKSAIFGKSLVHEGRIVSWHCNLVYYFLLFFLKRSQVDGNVKFTLNKKQTEKVTAI